MRTRNVLALTLILGLMATMPAFASVKKGPDVRLSCLREQSCPCHVEMSPPELRIAAAIRYLLSIATPSEKVELAKGLEALSVQAKLEGAKNLSHELASAESASSTVSTSPNYDAYVDVGVPYHPASAIFDWERDYEREELLRLQRQQAQALQEIAYRLHRQWVEDMTK